MGALHSQVVDQGDFVLVAQCASERSSAGKAGGKRAVLLTTGPTRAGELLRLGQCPSIREALQLRQQYSGLSELFQPNLDKLREGY